MSAILGPGIAIKSAIFSAGVRLPGSSMQAHYIPSEDYPLTYYPQAGVIEARVRDGVKPLANFTRCAWYHVSQVRDMMPSDEALAAQPQFKEQGGVLVSTGRMTQGPNGSFERVVDEPAAAPPDVPIETSAPKQVHKGWPKGKPRKAVAVAGGPEGGA